MTAIKSPDEAIASARKVAEYLTILDRGNALKNGATAVIPSQITQHASALVEYLIHDDEEPAPTNEQIIAELREYIEKRLTRGFSLHTYQRSPVKPGDAPYWEAVITEDGFDTVPVNIVATMSGYSEEAALRLMLGAMDR